MKQEIKKRAKKSFSEEKLFSMYRAFPVIFTIYFSWGELFPPIPLNAPLWTFVHNGDTFICAWENKIVIIICYYLCNNLTTSFF